MIYFLRSAVTGNIKIGTTVQYYERLGSLQREHGSLELIGWMHGNIENEKALHLIFQRADSTPGREWFQDTPTLRAYIEANTTPTAPVRPKPTTMTVCGMRLKKSTVKLIRIYAAELQQQSGKRVSDEAAILAIFQAHYPEIVAEASSP